MKSSILFGATLAALLPIQAYAGPAQSIMFPMTVSAGAAKCLPKAQATVIVHSVGTKEELEIVASGLPANTDFDVFNIQVPNAPFGESWYLGDIESDRRWQRREYLCWPVPERNLHNFARRCACAQIPRGKISGCNRKCDNWRHSNLSPWNMVQCASGRVESRLRQYRDPVQRLT